MKKYYDELLLFLYYEKAFDLVDQKCLFTSAEKIDFENIFFSWVKILISNPIFFKIKNNQGKNESFDMKCCL